MTRTRSFYENYVCGAERNYTGYCNPELDKLVDQQSSGGQPGKAQEAGLADRAEAGGGRRSGRSSSTRRGGTCWQPWVKGLTIMVNSIYNGWRMEDVWLDK